jgi:hypothetical protein
VSDFVPEPFAGWVSAELHGVSDVRGRLGKLADELDDFSGLWESLSDVMVEHELEWFGSEGEGSWPQLSEKYAAAKARAGYVPDILIREGDLLESLTDPARAASVGQGRSTLGTFSGQAFSWGTDEDTAEYHTRGRDDMPPRPPLVVTARLRGRIHEAAEDWLSDAVRSAGLGA